jgi:methyl-accepting chemotaxis protein
MSGGVLLQIASKFDAKGIGQATTGLDKLGKLAGGFGIAAGAAFAAVAAGAVAFGISSIKAAAESEAVAKSLEQIAKNSGAFGKTADEVQAAVKQLTSYTTELSKLTGVDDEVLNSIIRGFIAVPELAAKGVDGLKNMAKVALDVAAGTGKSVESIGSAFIKVAGDESTALSKLLRAGIVFTESQKDAYKQILETNGEIAAQDYLLGELGTTFEGAAEAAANPFLRLQAILEDFQENLGSAFLPALEDAIPVIQAAVDSFVASPEFATFIEDASAGFATMMESLPDILETMTRLGTDALPILNDLLPSFNSLLGFASGHMDDLAEGSNNAFQSLADVASVFKFVTDVGATVDAFLKKNGDNWGVFGSIVRGTIDAIIGALNPLLQSLNMVADLIRFISGVQERQANSGYANPAFANIPQMAEGGIVMPSRGGSIVNVAEAGQPEAIIPLDRLGNMGGGTTNNYSINVSAGVGDPAAIGQQIVTYIKKFERSGGPVFASA